MVSKLYDEKFYDEVVNDGALRSARVIVPVVLEECTYGVQRVADVGCGEGAWTSVFAELGRDVTGIDGAHVDRSRLMIRPEEFVPRELDQPGSLDTIGEHDLVVSLEVAEHLPPERAASFIAELCAIAPQVLFSAAVPGQGGVGHVNEQWPNYWAELFRDNGFLVSGALRFMFWEGAVDGVIENWYCVPDEAEALTRSGWKTFEKIDQDEEILVSGAWGELHWEVPLTYNVFDFDGELYVVNGHWATTGGHRWPIRSQMGWDRIKVTEDLKKNDRLAVAGTLQSAEDSLLSPRDAAVLGWIVGDGTWRIKPNGRPQAVIYQSPKKHLQAVKDLLGDEMTGCSTDDRPQSHGAVTCRISVTLLDRLLGAGFRDKADLPWMVCQLSPAALRAYWQALMDAEGDEDFSGARFNQNPGPVAESFQIASIMLGHRLNLDIRRGASVGGAGGKGVKSGMESRVHEVSRQPYVGKVWCPTTSTGTWMMRQNGRPVVTGNSQNLLLCVHDEFYERNRQWFGNWFEGLASLPIPLVHPVLFSHIRGLLR